MARAPETGFYFEPIGERLALVVEGSPFPSDDHWAWLGDPIAITPEQAQLLVAVRWPGVDPSNLFVEFDLNFERAVEAKEQAEREAKAGVKRTPLEFDLDIDQLLAQAEELRDQVRQVSLQATPAQAAEAREAAAEAERLRDLLAQARALTEPRTEGHAIEVPQAPPQSTRLLRGEPLAPPPDPTASSPSASVPSLPPGASPPAAPRESPSRAPRASAADAAAGRDQPSSGARAPEPDAPALIPEILPAAPRPSRPRIEKRSAPPEPAPEPPPEPKPAPRRPNIRNKR